MCVVYKRIVLFEFLSVGESRSYPLAQPDVTIVDGVERKEFHLLHVQLAIGGEEAFIALGFPFLS